MNLGSVVEIGDQWMDVLEVSTKTRSRVACRAQVCLGHECRILRMDDMRSCATIGDGCPSSPLGRLNSFVVTKERTFSDDTLSVIV